MEMEGEVWAGTVGGGLINLDNSTAPPLDAATGLPGNRVNDCVLVEDTLWVATDSGLASMGADQDRFEVYEYGRFLRVAAAGSTMLAARDDGNLLELHAGTDPTAAAYRQLDMTVLSLAGHANGSYAAGSIDGKVLVTAPDNLSGKTVRTGLPVVALAYDGDTLSALVPGQLLRLDGDRLKPVANSSDVVSLSRAGEALRSTQLAPYEVAASLRVNQTYYAATDSGVLRAIGSSNPTAATSPSPPEKWYRLPPRGCPCGPRIASIASYNGDLWVGGFDSGLCRFDGSSWHHFRAPDDMPSDMVNHMAVGRHRLYVATLKGLVVIDERGHFTTHKRSQCVDNTSANCPWYESITGIGADSESRNVWIADTGSVHRWSSRKWKHLYRKRGIISERITRIAANAGRIAVGTSDQGILWSDQTGDFVRMDDQQGLADNWVMDLTFDRSGALWVATCTRGLSRYHEGQWRNWSTDDGLADNYTLSVADIGGRIWVGHFRGISILTTTGTVHLGAEDGLPGGEVHDIVEHDGRVYLATDGGLAVVRVDGA